MTAANMSGNVRLCIQVLKKQLSHSGIMLLLQGIMFTSCIHRELLISTCKYRGLSLSIFIHKHYSTHTEISKYNYK